jgi:hypothetical protein
MFVLLIVLRDTDPHFEHYQDVRLLILLTMAFWVGYPVLMALGPGMGEVLSRELYDFLQALLDVGAKVGFGAVVYWKIERHHANVTMTVDTPRNKVTMDKYRKHRAVITKQMKDVMAGGENATSIGELELGLAKLQERRDQILRQKHAKVHAREAGSAQQQQQQGTFKLRGQPTSSVFSRSSSGGSSASGRFFAPSDDDEDAPPPTLLASVKPLEARPEARPEAPEVTTPTMSMRGIQSNSSRPSNASTTQTRTTSADFYADAETDGARSPVRPPVFASAGASTSAILADAFRSEKSFGKASPSVRHHAPPDHYITTLEDAAHLAQQQQMQQMQQRTVAGVSRQSADLAMVQPAPSERELSLQMEAIQSQMEAVVNALSRSGRPAPTL